MTDKEQNIKIAKFCGWKRCDTEEECYYRGEPDEFDMCPEHSDDFEDEDQLVPDYLNDLNAMHEAETLLNLDEMLRYDKFLAEITKSFTWNATASQRAEAFILTMEK